MEQCVGYLFKKKHIKNGENTQEIFMFKDFVAGFLFTNTKHNRLVNILTGNSAGRYASLINEEGNELEDVFVIMPLEKAVVAADNNVNFEKMKKVVMSKTTKYHIRNGKEELSSLLDKRLIKLADKEFGQGSTDFDEDEFKATSNISKMYSSIKKTIISQDEQIMIILTSIFKNQNVINSDLDIDVIAKLKENLLIYGATGTGKTEILKRISRLYEIPIVIEDATSLSETGYQGRDISDMLENLIVAAEGKISLAEKGILVIDEFDKLAEKDGNLEAHVSRLGVQRGLLKLLDGTDFYLKSNKKFNTSKLTVVALGAFTGIVKDVSHRPLGFGTADNYSATDVDNYNNLGTEDFTNYGIIRELIGRFSKFVAMKPLKREDIAKILIASDFSPLSTYKQMFDFMQIGFDYNEDFVNWLAEKAAKLNSGARSLKTVFDNCISGAMFRIFAGEYSAISLVEPQNDNDRPYILRKKLTEEKD